jgi:hypothetical protein
MSSSSSQHLRALCHPGAHVGDRVLGGPALLEVAGLVGHRRRHAIDERVEPLPRLRLTGDRAGIG